MLIVASHLRHASKLRYDFLVLGTLYEKQNCSAARALEVAGERWSLLILRDALFGGKTRFSDFQRDLGVAPNILTNRLDSFVAQGILEIRPYGPGSRHREYVPTPKGLEFKPVIVALTMWGDRWAAPNGPPVMFEHGGCGGKIQQPLECVRCSQIVKSANVLARATRRPGQGSKATKAMNTKKGKTVDS